MESLILQFLNEMSTDIVNFLGLASVPLIGLIFFRAGRLRGLNETNMAERLGDLCFDTIKEQINNKLQELLNNYFNNNNYLPRGRTIQEVSSHLHQDSESLERLLSILRNLTELGFQSTEFQQALEIISQFLFLNE